MSKRSIELCILSARGLKRSNPLWKLKTMCVAWINPDHKYCSKIDKTNDTHPAWNMKFSAIVDAEEDAAMTVEIHCQEPVFHLTKLECAALISLKEFIVKADKNSDDWVETASFQLRTPNGKPRGMVDVCVRIGSRFDTQVHSNATDEAEHDEDDGDEPVTAYPAELSAHFPAGRPENFPPPNYPYSYPPKTEQAPLTSSHAPPPPRPFGQPPPVGARPFGQPPPPYGYDYPPQAPPLGGNNYFGLPGRRPNYGGGQRPGLGLAAGAAAGGLGGAMLFGMDGISDAISSSQFHDASLGIYGDSLF